MSYQHECRDLRPWWQTLCARAQHALASGLCLLALSGCGWHLQGHDQTAVRVSPVYLDLKDLHSEFAQALQSRLNIAGVAKAVSPESARVLVEVASEQSGATVVAVSAKNEPQQYEVFYEVSYRIRTVGDSSADTAPAWQTSRLSRLMNYDKTAALAMQRQRQLLLAQLAKDLAGQVLRRMSIVAPAQAS